MKPRDLRVLVLALLGLTPAAAQSTDASDLLQCGPLALQAWEGQPVPGGGKLDTLWIFTHARLAGAGRIVFLANVLGAPGLPYTRIFSAGPGGLREVVGACDVGGCGTATPLGGTFTVLYGEASGGFGDFYVDTPAVNAAGDVLFLAKLELGSSPQGLFLYRQATDDIITVASIGHPGPSGPSFDQVGVGAVSDTGVVVFLARITGETEQRLMRWKAGTFSTVAAVGDPAPGGGAFTDICFSTAQLFSPLIPSTPRPAINTAEQVAFLARIDGQQGLVRTTDGVHELMLKVGDPVPGGSGNFDEFSDPHLNGWGELAFRGKFAATAGLFAGEPGAWRRIIVQGDPLPGGGTCGTLAASTNPFTPFDDAGNYVFWETTFGLPELPERIYVARADGGLQLVAWWHMPTPAGGLVAALGRVPSLRDGRVLIDADAPGGTAGGGVAHHVLPKALTWEDVGHALAGASGRPRLRGLGALSHGSPGALHLDKAPPGAPVWLFIGLSQALVPFKGGTLVPTPDWSPLLFATNAQGSLDLPWASWPFGLPSCLELVFQAWVVDDTGPKGATASNGLVGRTP